MWVIKEDKYYNNLWEQVHQKVPEFKSIWDSVDIYLTMAEFGEFLIKNIADNGISEKCFLFINEALEKGGNKTEDVIVSEIFQQLYEYPDLIHKAQERLSPYSKDIFDKFYKKFIEES
jgi:hypothetical protein